MSKLWPGNAGIIDYISHPPQSDFIDRFPRSVAILGSTGSIGLNALDVVAKSGSFLKICGLAAGKNIELLAEQASKFRPSCLCVLDGALATRLRGKLPPDYNPLILSGPEGYAQIAAMDEADVVLSAQVGIAGLAGTIAAALAGKVIALANKESLVVGGNLLRRICGQTKASILPVDSEHYAVFCCLAGRGAAVRKIVLTASGGPFRGRKKEDIARLNACEALCHPTWKMGAKISVDSATLMNKGLEVIETIRLFGISLREIEVLVHPQSIIHSLVMFSDNSMLGQFAVADMRLSIGGCLLWPHEDKSFIKELDLANIGTLTFEKPDMDTFPCFALALEAASAISENRDRLLDFECIGLNAANEAAVQLFLENRCSFGDIPDLVGNLMRSLDSLPFTPAQKCGNDALKLTLDIEKFDRICREEIYKRAGMPDF